MQYLPFAFMSDRAISKVIKTRPTCKDCYVFTLCCLGLFSSSCLTHQWKYFPASRLLTRSWSQSLSAMSKSRPGVWCHVQCEHPHWEHWQAMRCSTTRQTTPTHTLGLQSSSFIRNIHSPFFFPPLSLSSVPLSFTPIRRAAAAARERVSEWVSERERERESGGRASGWSSVWSLSSRRLSPGVFGRAVYRCLTLGLIRSTGEIKLSQDVSRETSVSSKFLFLLPLLVPTMIILINLLPVSVNYVSRHRLFGLLVLKEKWDLYCAQRRA